MYINSLDNSDGYGIFSIATNNHIKSKDPAFNCIDNILKFMDKNKSELFLCHVRAASTLKNKEDDNFSHPFITDNYVVFHNGTYTGFYSNDKTDTWLFAEKLSENYTGDIIKDYTKTYNGGKFANFIIDRNNCNIYVIRGKTAMLYEIKLRINGKPLYIINTSNNSIIHAMNLLYQSLALFKNKVTIEYDEITLLPENTAFIYNNGLVKIGNIEEKQYTTITTSYYVNHNNTEDDKVITNLVDLGLTVFEVEIMLYAMERKRLKDCYRYTPLEDLYSKIKNYYSSEKYKLWRKLLNREKSMFILDIYRKYNLKVPYFINSMEELKRCLNT